MEFEVNETAIEEVSGVSDEGRSVVFKYKLVTWLHRLTGGITLYGVALGSIFFLDLRSLVRTFAL